MNFSKFTLRVDHILRVPYDPMNGFFKVTVHSDLPVEVHLICGKTDDEPWSDRELISTVDTHHSIGWQLPRLVPWRMEIVNRSKVPASISYEVVVQPRSLAYSRTSIGCATLALPLTILAAVLLWLL